MTLTKWNAQLIEGLDEAVDGEMEGDYLPLEGGTLTGELTVDANLILEGSITEGTLDLDLKEHANSEFIFPNDPNDSKDTYWWPQYEYILSPSQGTMQHLTVKTIYDGSGKDSDAKNSLFVVAPDQSENISEKDQDYFFEDGQSMTIRIEVEDLDRPKSDRYPFLHRWHDDIWWVNTKDGLAPDLNETGAITVNLWKAKGVLYGQLAGDFVKQPEREGYHPNAFDFSKVNRIFSSHESEPQRWVGHRTQMSVTPLVWQPKGGINYRQGTTFARTSRDGLHFFIGQSGGDGWFDKDYPENNTLYPGEFRMFSGNINANSRTYDPSPIPKPFDFRAPTGGYDSARPSVDSKLLGTATDMRLRVDKGTGVDFNPDGTRMFQSVACYHDPSLKDKYKNVIGFHQLSTPWDVGSTDFLEQGKLNDIIYCDEKYSAVLALHPEHPDMRICGLTFRPDGMGFYFAYVLYSLTKRDIEYYFVQQDLEEPWELSSAKEEYKYSNKFSHAKAPVQDKNWDSGNGNVYPSVPHLWQINGMTVSQNGRFIHAVYPHNYLTTRNNNQGLAHPRQFEMTTPWDISTAGNMYRGLGPKGQHMCHENAEQTHAVYWDESGEECYFSYVVETIQGSGNQPGFYNASFYKQSRFGLIEE